MLPILVMTMFFTIVLISPVSLSFSFCEKSTALLSVQIMCGGGDNADMISSVSTADTVLAGEGGRESSIAVEVGEGALDEHGDLNVTDC